MSDEEMEMMAGFEEIPLDPSSFPQNVEHNNLADLIAHGLANLRELQGPNGDQAFVSGPTDSTTRQQLLRDHAQIPLVGKSAKSVVSSTVKKFFPGAVVWRSPWLQHNVGTAVNAVASALYALGMDMNIYQITDDLAGNAVVAEQAVASCPANLAGR